ncbi:hypothetical protein MMC22_010557 [Lobaria immixta]|nr:hypothetical protein [Lobaria immixta]
MTCQVENWLVFCGNFPRLRVRLAVAEPTHSKYLRGCPTGVWSLPCSTYPNRRFALWRLEDVLTAWVTDHADVKSKHLLNLWSRAAASRENHRKGKALANSRRNLTAADAPKAYLNQKQSGNTPATTQALGMDGVLAAHMFQQMADADNPAFNLDPAFNIPSGYTTIKDTIQRAKGRKTKQREQGGREEALAEKQQAPSLSTNLPPPPSNGEDLDEELRAAEARVAILKGKKRKKAADEEAKGQVKRQRLEALREEEEQLLTGGLDSDSFSKDKPSPRSTTSLDSFPGIDDDDCFDEWVTSVRSPKSRETRSSSRGKAQEEGGEEDESTMENEARNIGTFNRGKPFNAKTATSVVPKAPKQVPQKPTQTPAHDK